MKSDDNRHAEILDKLIRQTIQAAGDVPPDQLPHYVRRQLEGRLTGEMDVESYVRHVQEQLSATQK